MAKTKAKAKAHKKIFSPFLLSLACTAGWAATHAPSAFSSAGLVGAWLIAALAVGLSTRAVLALISPLLNLASDFIQHLSDQESTNSEDDA